MKTLKQILEGTEEFKGRTIYIAFICGLVKEWLQQKQKTLECWDDAKALMNELLEELKET